MANFRRRGSGASAHLAACSQSSPGRFGAARQVWPPAHIQIAHPSIGLATLVNGVKLQARSNHVRRDMLKALAADSGAGGGLSGAGAKGKGSGDDAVTRLIDKYGDAVGQVGFGSIVGFCSGFALIKVGKMVAVVVGVSFVVAQGLNYAGIVDVKWSKVEENAKKFLDANNDSKVDKEDAKALWIRLKTALTHNMPAGGAFAGGFALGACCG